MKPFLKKILLFLADAVTLIISCFAAYYISSLIGLTPSELFVNSWYLFVAIKLAVYVLFFMYSYNPYRMRAIDIIGSGVANLVAVIVMMLLFQFDIGLNIVPIAISLIWDIAAGVLLRMLFENLFGFDEYEYEDDEEDGYDEYEDSESIELSDNAESISSVDDISIDNDYENAEDKLSSDFDGFENIGDLDIFLDGDMNYTEGDAIESDGIEFNEQSDISDDFAVNIDIDIFEEDDEEISLYDVKFDDPIDGDIFDENSDSFIAMEDLTQEADHDLDALDMVVNIGDLNDETFDIFTDSDGFDDLGNLFSVGSDVSEPEIEFNDMAFDNEADDVIEVIDKSKKNDLEDDTEIKSEFASSDEVALEIENITNEYFAESAMADISLVTSETEQEDETAEIIISPTLEQPEYDSLAIRNLESLAEIEMIVEDAISIDEEIPATDSTSPVLVEVAESKIEDDEFEEDDKLLSKETSADAEMLKPEEVIKQEINSETNLIKEPNEGLLTDEAIQTPNKTMENKDYNNQSNADITLAKIKKQEIIDSLVSDIKNMYMNLSDKNKSLEDRERELFVKYVQLDQREKEMQMHRDRLSTAGIENKWRNSRFIEDDEVFGPSDNLDLVMEINNLLDSRNRANKETRTAFVNMTPVNDMQDDEVHAELERLKLAEEERIRAEKEQEELEMRRELERLREAFRLEKQKEEEARLQKELEEKEELERLRRAEEERALEEKRKKDEEKRAEYERLMKAQEELERIRQANEDRQELERLRKEETERLATEEAVRLAKEETERKLREEMELKAREEAELRAKEEAELRAREAEERLAREEAERIAMEEAVRLAKEETARKLREEMDLKAREEAELRAKEEAERLAREEEERLAREEAERIAREEAVRLAKEETERKLREEMELKAKEEAELRAKEEAERLAREEEERLAREEAERIAREEAVRLAKEETERKLREEMELKAREEAELRAKEEAERLAREEEERIAKEQEELRLRDELKRKEAEAALLKAKANSEKMALAEMKALAEEKQRKLDEEKINLERQLEAERIKVEEEKKKQIEATRLLLEKERENEQKRLEAKRKAYEMSLELEKLRAENAEIKENEQAAKIELSNEEPAPMLTSMLDALETDGDETYSIENFADDISVEKDHTNEYEGKSLLDSL